MNAQFSLHFSPAKKQVITHEWLGIDLHWAYSNLLLYIGWKVGCIERAHDVLHDAFLRFAFAQQGQIQEPHAYLRVIVHSLIANHYKAQQAIEYCDSGTLDAYLEKMQNQQLSYAPSAEHICLMEERLKLVTAIIEALPKRCREVFWLFRMEGCSQKEIAVQLNISLNMVEKHMIRAMLELRAAKELLY